MPPHKSKSTSITCDEGQQNGAGVSSPLRFLLHGRAGLCLVLLWSLRGLYGGRFPANVPPSPQRPSEAKAWPHPSALPPLALGKPASPRTVRWLVPCIARWFAQRRARRGNAYSVGYADLVCFCEAWPLRVCLIAPPIQPVRLRGVALRCSFPARLPRFPSAPEWLPQFLKDKASVVCTIPALAACCRRGLLHVILDSVSSVHIPARLVTLILPKRIYDNDSFPCVDASASGRTRA